MNEQRILINRNEMAAGYAVDAATQAAKAINERLVPLLKSIGSPLTQKVLSDIFAGNNLVEKSYYDNLSKDLSNIKTPAVSDSMRLNADVAWTNFQSSVSSIRHEVGNHFNFLTIVDGVVTLTLEKENEIRETYYRYLVDEKEIAAYHLFIDIADKLTTLFASNGVPLFWNQLFPADSNGVIHVNENIIFSQFI